MNKNKRLMQQARVFNKNFPYTTMNYYLRKKDGTPYGVVVAIIFPAYASVGYHAVRLSEAGTFDKQVARMIATKRAVHYNNTRAPGYDKLVEKVRGYANRVVAECMCYV